MDKTGDLVKVADLAALLDDGQCRPVDCRFDLFDVARGRRDYTSAHIPDAVYADMDRDLASEITAASGRHPLPDPGEFRRRLESWGISDDTMVVAYDYGNSSLAVRLWWMLKEWLGHERVAVLDGGIAAWRAAGLPLSTDAPRPESGLYTRQPDGSVIATTDEILRLVEGGNAFLLVDARDPARFRGDVEPIDTVAGHVPGARNLPLGGNLGEDGTWRTPAELAERWRRLQAATGPQPPIVMCGSGVTACHLALAARLAGRPTPRLYVGSWSEWIRDPRRPVATGSEP